MTNLASRSRLKWALFLLALTTALFVVVASACGGGDDDNGGGDSNATPTKEAANGATGTAKATPTKEASNNGGGNNSDAVKKLKDLAGEYEKFEGFVKYSASDFTDSSLSAMAIYQKGDKSRIDIESSEGNVTIITTPDASYMCSENQCLKYPSGDTTGAGAVEGFTSFLDPNTIESDFGDIPEGVDVKVSDTKIAGVSATCFSANGDLDTSSPGDESGEICFSDNGLLLRLKFDSGGQSGTLEATDAGDASDSDFEPPYDVIDFSDIGQ